MITAIEHGGPRTLVLGDAAVWIAGHAPDFWIDADAAVVAQAQEHARANILREWLDQAQRYYESLVFLGFPVDDEARRLESTIERVRPSLALAPVPLSQALSLHMTTAFMDLLHDRESVEAMERLVCAVVVVSAVCESEVPAFVVQDLVDGVLHTINPRYRGVLAFVDFHIPGQDALIPNLLERICACESAMDAVARPLRHQEESSSVITATGVDFDGIPSGVMMLRDPVFTDTYYVLAWEEGQPVLDLDVAVAVTHKPRSIASHALFHLLVPAPNVLARAAGLGLVEFASRVNMMQVGPVSLKMPVVSAVRLFNVNVNDPIDAEAVLRLMAKNVYCQRLAGVAQSVRGILSGAAPPDTGPGQIVPLLGLRNDLHVFGVATQPTALVDWRRR